MKSRTVARAFGRVLRTARLARGLTQEALAEAAGIDRTYPSLLERGLREPTLTVILQLANALHCSPTDLVTATLARLPARYARQWLVVELPSPDPPATPPRDPYLVQAA
jgi:transcriptional regulator with XRE-family HTH domain